MENDISMNRTTRPRRTEKDAALRKERKSARVGLRKDAARLARERDRLSLLLEINNHIVSKLELNELFQAVAQSTRKHFGNGITSFLLLNRETGCLERKFLDFRPAGAFWKKLLSPCLRSC